jgi:hypothetical protein
MVDLLVCYPTIVLQHVEVLGATGDGELFYNRKDLREVFVGKSGERWSVVFRYY